MKNYVRRNVISVMLLVLPAGCATGVKTNVDPFTEGHLNFYQGNDIPRAPERPSEKIFDEIYKISEQKVLPAMMLLPVLVLRIN